MIFNPQMGAKSYAQFVLETSLVTSSNYTILANMQIEKSIFFEFFLTKALV